MFKKCLLVLLSLALVRGVLFGGTSDSTAKVGDIAIAELTGDIAREYDRIKGNSPESGSQDRLPIEIGVQIKRLMENGRIYFVHELEMKADSNHVIIRMLGTVEPSQISTDVLSKTTSLPPSATEKSKLTTSETRTLRFHIGDVKTVKIQKWKLIEEIGE